VLYAISIYSIEAYTEFTNYCCRLLINLDFCFKACAPCVRLVQKHRLQDVYATVLWHCQSAAGQCCPIYCYDFYKKVMITSLQKEYSTESVIYTYEYSLKVS